LGHEKIDEAARRAWASADLREEHPKKHNVGRPSWTAELRAVVERCMRHASECPPHVLVQEGHCSKTALCLIAVMPLNHMLATKHLMRQRLAF